ncbi:FAD:protein FMN transferase [Stutzerimonas nosocomialis]|uniref:FAD:protein FMN transferase n=1 Tax=Stutzerimonas nosocomialis TaxID=1056496 RepID=UPI001109C1E8|nr:FAD:protein FMN transferase [Stutzerimonas nosocomialis]TLX59440.1 FAD:protein FMN transferase [Stutzerimonas nosocomialis]
MSVALIRPVIAVALATALTGCLFQDRIESFAGPAQGSTYSVKYVKSRGVPDKVALQRETDAILEQIDRELSTYRSDSAIERFNEMAANSCQSMPASIFELLEVSRQLSAQSDGAFDPTLEPLLNLWGFGPRAKGEGVPSDEAIAEARALTGLDHFRRDGEQLCKDGPAQLEFNGIAAGYSVDRVSERLKSLGVTSYLVEITGELKAEGRKPDGSAWRIGVEEPRDDQRVAQRVIELDGYGISTSGDYRNYFERDGQRYSHTLDPRTGAPIAHTLAAVTVADRSTLLADGLSTLLMVLGPERGFDFAAENSIPSFFVIREGGGFVTKSTEAFDELFGAGGNQ